MRTVRRIERLFQSGLLSPDATLQRIQVYASVNCIAAKHCVCGPKLAELARLFAGNVDDVVEPIPAFGAANEFGRCANIATSGAPF